MTQFFKYIIFAVLFGMAVACVEESETGTINSNGVASFIIEDFIPAVQTKTALQTSSMSFQWSENDAVGIFPKSGWQAEFSMKEGAGSNVAVFDGGSWTLKQDATYYAYYPFSKENFDSKDMRETVSYSYEGQEACFADENGLVNLSKYDFMASGASDPVNGEVEFRFKHLGALCHIHLTVPKTATYSKFIIETTDKVFPVSGHYDATDKDGDGEFPFIAANKSSQFEVSFPSGNQSFTESEEVDFYFLMPPVDLMNQIVTFKMYDSGNNVLEYEIESKIFEAGRVYSWDIYNNPKEGNNYVGLDWEKTNIINYNGDTGVISINASQNALDDLNEKSVIILPQEYKNEIRIINSISKDDEKLTLSTSQGNMCHLFKNTEFTLMTSTAKAVAMTKSGNNQVITPSVISLINENGESLKIYDVNDLSTRSDYVISKEIISLHEDFSGKYIYKDGNNDFYYEKGVFDIGLDGVFKFKFSSEPSDKFDLMGKLENLECYLEGDINIDILQRYVFNSQKSWTTGFDNTDYIKKNFIKDVEFKFLVGGIPVIVTVSTHLCKMASLEVSSNINFSTGFLFQSQAKLGMKYSKLSKRGTSIADCSLNYHVYPPVLTAAGSIDATGSIYPRFDIKLYNFIGPSIEPIPYLKQEVRAGLRASTDGKSYIGWDAHTYSGVYGRVNLLLGAFGIDKETWESDLLSIKEPEKLICAPHSIELVSPKLNSRVKPGQMIPVEFKTTWHNLINNESYPLAGAIIEFEGDGEFDDYIVLSDADGIAKTNWRPTPPGNDKNNQR